jgi:phage tail protein X
MGNEFYEYITKDGDRWDLIAYEFYSDPTLYESIITANPEVPITPILPSGLKLKIPVREDKEEIEFILPPWRS